MKRPTLRDIAEKAGVSHVTVSMALRDHPRIAEETRERIKKIARQIGYRPDPVLAALNVYRCESRKPKYQATLAWLNFHRIPVKEHGFECHMFKGAQERCDELGYLLEEFQIEKLGISLNQLSRILYSRNIQGVIFAPQSRSMRQIGLKEFAWNQFSVISLGFSLMSPKLDVVIDGQYRAARLVVQKLKSLGYRRIGFVTDADYNERTDGNLLGGYLCEQFRFPLENRITPLILDSVDDPAPLREWFQCYQPDAVFDVNGYLSQNLTPKELGRCGIATHGNWGGGCAGVDQNIPLIGRVAVNELVAMIHANIQGIPAVPRRILVEGTWVDGGLGPRAAFQ